MRDRGAGPSRDFPLDGKAAGRAPLPRHQHVEEKGATQGGQSLSRMAATKSDVRCRWCLPIRLSHRCKRKANLA